MIQDDYSRIILFYYTLLDTKFFTLSEFCQKRNDIFSYEQDISAVNGDKLYYY